MQVCKLTFQSEYEKNSPKNIKFAQVLTFYQLRGLERTIGDLSVDKTFYSWTKNKNTFTVIDGLDMINND